MASAIKTRNLVHKTSLLSKFKGSLVGAVVGDCLGAPFEASWDVKLEEVKGFLSQLHSTGDESKEEKSKIFKFTDDTAMTRSVTRSLVENKGLNVRDLAKRFVDEYYKEKWRGYGGNVVTVFSELQKEDCANPHGPATKQFDGQGSYGNGAAMRISPTALFGYQKNLDELNKIVSDISKITHSHPDAIVGAQLECAAVHTALHQKASLDKEQFIQNLVNLVDKLEPVATEDSDSPPKAKRRAKRPSEEVPQPYSHKLKLIKEHLLSGNKEHKNIEELLGNDISALGSVPAAVFSFLLCNGDLENFETDNAFERTIMYAISLGGDTDTIATMAGAIAGAYYGIELIPQHWINLCEGTDDAIETAASLYSIAVDSNDEKENGNENFKNDKEN